MNTQEKAKAQEVKNDEKLRDTNGEDIKRIVTNGEVVDNTKKEKKRQAVSKTYTLKSFGSNITKLAQLGLITEEEQRAATKIKDAAVNKYISTQF